MNQNEWQEIYRNSKRGGPIATPQPPELRRAPVPTGEIPASVTVIRPIKADETAKS